MTSEPDAKPVADRILLLGIVIGAVLWSGLALSLAVRGRQIPWFSFLYNIPITLVFGALLFAGIVEAAATGVMRAAGRHLGILAVWSLGGVVLFLRLVTKSVDVSGHMTWAILLGVQCILQRQPAWFSLCVWAVALQVLVLKLFILGGHSGQWGLAFGATLGLLLWFQNRLRATISTL